MPCQDYKKHSFPYYLRINVTVRKRYISCLSKSISYNDYPLSYPLSIKLLQKFAPISIIFVWCFWLRPLRDRFFGHFLSHNVIPALFTVSVIC